MTRSDTNESEIQTLITQRAEDLRNPSYLCWVLEQCYEITGNAGYCFISNHIDAVVKAIIATGGSFPWRPRTVTSLFQLSKRLGPVGMVSLVPLFRPMIYDLGCILHFLNQDLHVNVPGDDRLSMAFKKENCRASDCSIIFPQRRLSHPPAIYRSAQEISQAAAKILYGRLRTGPHEKMEAFTGARYGAVKICPYRSRMEGVE